jgi:3-hydroxyisobutyrate dehydrogenase-like beta-hydroxyacid dehydrogenase
MTSIGFVGMGSRMAARLLDGNQVSGTNRARAEAADLIGAGLIWRDTPREVAAEVLAGRPAAVAAGPVTR